MIKQLLTIEALEMNELPIKHLSAYAYCLDTQLAVLVPLTYVFVDEKKHYSNSPM